MKASDLYEKSSSKVDSLQRSLRNHVSDQFAMTQELMEEQDRMKRLMEILMSGDRELTGEEILLFQKLPTP